MVNHVHPSSFRCQPDVTSFFVACGLFTILYTGMMSISPINAVSLLMPIQGGNLSENAASAVPIVRRKLGHEVLERLLVGIRAGSFPVGSLLPSERELMSQFSVGRPAVREGLQALERMGLVSIVHGAGARVQSLSADSVISQISATAIHLLSGDSQLLEHLKEARIAFEVAMARSAAIRATDDDIISLQAALDAHSASLGNPSLFLETDLELHRLIATVSGNPVYVAVSQAMLQWLSNFHEDLVRAPGVEEVTLEEHKQLVACIARHDPDAAEQAIREHLTRANQLYLSSR